MEELVGRHFLLNQQSTDLPTERKDRRTTTPLYRDTGQYHPDTLMANKSEDRASTQRTPTEKEETSGEHTANAHRRRVSTQRARTCQRRTSKKQEQTPKEQDRIKLRGISATCESEEEAVLPYLTMIQPSRAGGLCSRAVH